MRMRLVGVLALGALVGAAIPAGAEDGGRNWAKRLGGSGGDYAVSVASDPSGNAFLGGYTEGSSIDLGGGPLSGAGPSDMVVAKYSAGGAHLWSKRLGGSLADRALSVVSDPSGNVLLAGYTDSPSIDLGGGPLSGAGGFDIVVAKYSAGGMHLWSKRLGGNSNSYAVSVASDASGDVLLGGVTAASSIDLGGGPLSGVGNLDIVIAKYSEGGAHLWSKRLGGNSNDDTSSVASDPSGNVLLAGYTDSPSIDLGGGSLGSAGFPDIVVAKYSAAGAHLWSKRLGGNLDDRANSVASDPLGNVLLGGVTTSSSIDLGGGDLRGDPLNAGASDIVVAKYSAAGAHLWSKRLGGSNSDYGSSVASDPSGNVLLGGMTYSSSIELGGGPLSGAGGSDIVVAEYSPTGAHLWSRRLGGSGYDVAYSVASDPSDNVLLGGFTDSSSIELADGPLSGAGSYDIVVAKYIDAVAPVSALDLQPVTTTGPLPAGQITGTSDDDLSGIESVSVKFEDIATGSVSTIETSLACGEDRNHCTFSVAVPGDPGSYDVTAQARDRAGNLESPGPSAIILVL
jgi:beta-propeller repeat-containing protein